MRQARQTLRAALAALIQLVACTTTAPTAPSASASARATPSASDLAPRPPRRAASGAAEDDDIAGPALRVAPYPSTRVDVVLPSPHSAASAEGPPRCTLDTIAGLSVTERGALARALEKSARALIGAAERADWPAMRRLAHSTRGLSVQSAAPIAAVDIAGAALRSFDEGAAPRSLADHLRDAFAGRDPIAAHRRVQVGAEWRDREGQICVDESWRWSFANDEPWVVVAPTEGEVDRGTQSAFVVVFARDGRDWRTIALLVPPWTP